jgi:hypothetical protein
MVKVSTFALIRYIVEIPAELEYRIYLRNELFASGFRTIIKELRKWAPDEFHDSLAHIEAFEASAANDFESFIKDLDLSFDIDLFDHTSLIQALDEGLKEDSVSFSHITTILQHLLIPSRLYDAVSR